MKDDSIADGPMLGQRNPPDLGLLILKRKGETEAEAMDRWEKLMAKVRETAGSRDGFYYGSQIGDWSQGAMSQWYGDRVQQGVETTMEDMARQAEWNIIQRVRADSNAHRLLAELLPSDQPMLREDGSCRVCGLIHGES